MTEVDILGILREKHTNDLFVHHCKVGPSYGNGQLILDAWVMPFSWTKPIKAYEIKVNKSDFRRDHKWRSYLFYCNLFYFVVPWGLIEKQEVPEPAGLIYITKTGSGIRYIKRPEPMWHNDIPRGIFQYVLMWRRQELMNNEPFIRREIKE